MIRSPSWGEGSRGCDGEASRDVRGIGDRLAVSACDMVTE